MNSIFDFDLSVTRKHTFKRTQILTTQCPFTFNEQEYHRGIAHAHSNLKAHVNEFLKHDDSDNMSAIATFHNNHSYIAGYMAFLFERHLTLKEIRFSTGGLSAAAIYQIEGITKPFIISYIPAADDVFNLHIDDLENNKNHQINHIRQIWHTLKLAEEDAPVCFYDDNAHNCYQALSMPLIKVNQVNRHAQDRIDFAECLSGVSLSSTSSSDSIESAEIAGDTDMPAKTKPGFFKKTGSVARTAMNPSRLARLAQIKQFVFDGNHHRVDEYLRAEAPSDKESSAKFIAGFYAEAGNHQMANRYIKQYPKALQFVIQGYAFVGDHDSIKQYYEKGLVTSEYISGCYHRAGNTDKSSEYEQLTSQAIEGSSYRFN
ncbi:Uncharacterised protein [Legionella quateirensis]|uniref:Uncharacterized protein n=2 Tax=Legionella quateirensis TaxID=45072 RepID=A0A378KZB4_9GAMM|nr:hypothetical protein Lqua_2383 [Legionella quateirensis]STY18951.1 Uncharacterised protein [Legionella quateirensis]